jgi:hypothetical protein
VLVRLCTQKQRRAEEEEERRREDTEESEEGDEVFLGGTGSDDQQEAQAEPTSTSWFYPGCVEAMHPECFVRVSSHELGGDVDIHVRQGPIKLCFNPHHHHHQHNHSRW